MEGGTHGWKGACTVGRECTRFGREARMVDRGARTVVEGGTHGYKGVCTARRGRARL
jgi:hypothetical protein